MNENYAELMTAFPLFKGFTSNGAKRLLDAGHVKQHQAGTVLLKEGDPADFVLLVLTGALEVFVERDGQHLILNQAEPGDILGELAVLCGIPRSASVKARNAAAVLEWSDEAFRTLLLRDPSLSQRIFREALRTLVEKERSLIDSVIDAQEEAHKSYSADS
ncbi:MAG TPA: cyclic nucleotide-binding domain-containing protein [Pyrinomonadaceae bacterium]|nr:cyclic nucleotide-binding domain-containing protein [Pyrinomonadaceae bacterium]